MINRFKSNRGQTLVEFALILALLLILVFGIIELGILLYNKAVLTYASREGARAAVVFIAAPNANRFVYSPLTEANIKTAVNSYAQSKLITFGTGFDANATSPLKAVDIAWYDKDNNLIDTSDSSQYPYKCREGTISVIVNFRYTFLILPRFGSPGGMTLDLHAQTIMRME